MKTLLLWLAAIVLGLITGVVSALWMAGWLTGSMPFNQADEVSVEGWNSNWAIGSEAADPYTRALIAKRGLLALNHSEAVYFDREIDSEGRPLQAGCAYEIEGGVMPARWWSVTLYAQDDYLARNEDEADSVDASDFAATGDWRAFIGPQAPEDGGAWLSANKAGNFNLLLRLYNPEQVVLDDPGAALNPPRVTRAGCEEAAK